MEECAMCGKEFEYEVWIDGSCPYCGCRYSWDEVMTDDGDMAVMVWED